MNGRSLMRTWDAVPPAEERQRRPETPLKTAALEGEADRLATKIVEASPAAARSAPIARNGEPRAAEAERSLRAVRPAAERALGHDFGSLSVQAGPAAAGLARRLDAIAFVDADGIALDPDALPADAPRRHHVLAHELAHVAQRAEGRAPAGAVLRQQRPRPAAVDADAQRIIDLAADSSRTLADRGPAVVRALIAQYNSSEASKIGEINYREAEPGLAITYRGRGADTVGILTVGRYFVEHTDQRNFARRISQVRHELEHVDQQRSGMTGANRSDEREFAAFYHEALSTAPTGAGRMQHATRVDLIDGALGYFCCLSAELQRANTSKRDELLQRRAEEIRRSGHSDFGEAPTTCRRQGD